MDEKREELFIDELKTQIAFSMYSIEGVNDYLTKLEVGNEGDPGKFWYHAQNLIVYSGNLSKILWGLPDRNQTKDAMRRRERTELREKLNVSEESFLKKRFLRNALEHIDEKLEEFTENPQSIILNKNFGPVKKMFYFGDDEYDPLKKNLRHYDQYDKIYYFYGLQVSLEELIRNVYELKRNIDIYESNQTAR